MAIVRVQDVYSSFPSESVVTGNALSAPTTAGNLLLVLIGHANESSTSNTVMGITDDAGNTYVQAPGAVAQSILDGNWISNTDIWYCQNCKSGATQATITLTGTEDIFIFDFVEYSGVKTSGSFDSASPSHGGGQVIGGNITPSVANELLVCVSNNGNYAYSEIDPPWTDIEIPGDAGYGTAEFINAPLSVQNCTFSPATATSPFDFATSSASFLPNSSPSTNSNSMFLVF